MNKTSSDETRITHKVKRSEFIAIINPIFSQIEFQTFLKGARKEFHNARHICWAYRFIDGEFMENSSDAGEPSGTAGQPILNTLRKYQAVQTAIVVVRYFGGIELGKKGLMEAYTAAAEKLCFKVQWKEWIETETIVITGDYKSAGKIKYWMTQHHGKQIKDSSSDRLRWVIDVPRHTNYEGLAHLNVEIKKEAGTKPRR
ncbi:MAG: IMPACT family protein [Fidelibacterota bacterium]